MRARSWWARRYLLLVDEFLEELTVPLHWRRPCRKRTRRVGRSRLRGCTTAATLESITRWVKPRRMPHMARVLHLFRAPKKQEAMEEISAVRVIENVGFDRCAHARPNGRRQVLLVDVETLQKFGLVPGIIR